MNLSACKCSLKKEKLDFPLAKKQENKKKTYYYLLDQLHLISIFNLIFQVTEYVPGKTVPDLSWMVESEIDEKPLAVKKGMPLTDIDLHRIKPKEDIWVCHNKLTC